MKTVKIKVGTAKVGELVTLSSGYSVSKIEVLSIDDKKTTCKNIKTGFVFKLDLDKEVEAQRELSEEYIENRSNELKSLLNQAQKDLKEGLKSGVLVHPSDANNLTYLGGERYTRMMGYIGQLKNELEQLTK